MSEDKKRASGQRPRKRKFVANRYTLPDDSNLNISGTSASSKKLKSTCFEDSVPDNGFSGYRVIDIHAFCKEISNCVCCKICGSEVQINESRMHGLASKFSLYCCSCKELSYFKNCKSLGDNNKMDEINTRFIYAMRCLGNGWAGMNAFCSVMDLPPPVQKATYTKVVKSISSSASNIANISMMSSAEKEIKITGESQITVSGDGSWKTRGHNSQIGLTSVIGAETGKVLDIEVMSSFCKGCTLWKNPKMGDEYENWKKKHEDVCIKNHSGSSGKMEVDGMLKMFRRSEEKHNAQYINYIGDGDTKTFLELEKSHVYGANVELKKIECVGHVQKRMGTRLRNLKKNMQGKKLGDGKPLSGKGRLTDKLINQLTSYYGNAIRSNKNSLIDMRKAVWAIYYHKRSTDEEPLHDFCPAGENSWCPYQISKSVGKEKMFKHKNVLPLLVMDSIKSIFKDLSDPALLRRCLGGRTQNSNESFNALVWKFCPKSGGSSRLIADIAANEAVVLFNEGRKGRIEIMKSLGLRIGENALNAASKFDTKRISEAERYSFGTNLEQRSKVKQKKINL